MKSKICFVIAILITSAIIFQAFSQNPKEIEISKNKDKNKIHDLGIRSKSMYLYLFSSGKISGPYGKILVESCYYDTCGNVIEDYYPGFNGEQYKVNYIYDKNDLLIRRMTTNTVNGITSFVDYIYDGNRNIISEIRYSSISKLKTVDTYKYDNKNRLIEKNGRTFYEYDDVDNLINTIEYSSNEPVHNYKRELIYDNSGRIIESKRYSDGNLQLVEYNKYNSDGFLKENYSDLVDAIYSDYKSFYEYDDSGNLTGLVLFEGDRISYNSKFLYDVNGFLIEKLNLDQNGIPASLYIYVYEYY